MNDKSGDKPFVDRRKRDRRVRDEPRREEIRWEPDNPPRRQKSDRRKDRVDWNG